MLNKNIIAATTFLETWKYHTAGKSKHWLSVKKKEGWKAKTKNLRHSTQVLSHNDDRSIT